MATQMDNKIDGTVGTSKTDGRVASSGYGDNKDDGVVAYDGDDAGYQTDVAIMGGIRAGSNPVGQKYTTGQLGVGPLKA